MQQADLEREALQRGEIYSANPTTKNLDRFVAARTRADRPHAAPVVEAERAEPVLIHDPRIASPKATVAKPMTTRAASFVESL